MTIKAILHEDFDVESTVMSGDLKSTDEGYVLVKLVQSTWITTNQQDKGDDHNFPPARCTAYQRVMHNLAWHRTSRNASTSHLAEYTKFVVPIYFRPDLKDFNGSFLFPDDPFFLPFSLFFALALRILLSLALLKLTKPGSPSCPAASTPLAPPGSR